MRKLAKQISKDHEQEDKRETHQMRQILRGSVNQPTSTNLLRIHVSTNLLRIHVRFTHKFICYIFAVLIGVELSPYVIYL